MTGQTPMLVLGGFLGTGKTTLVNRILSDANGRRYAVFVNDFGAINVDQKLIAAHGGDTISFSNGCLCCSMGNDLVGAIDRLLNTPHPPEQILVEASGISDPALISDVATLHPSLRRDLTIVLTDHETLQVRYHDPKLKDTISRQLTAADLLVINKCDCLSNIAQNESEVWLRQHISVPILRAVNADIPMDLLATEPLPRVTVMRGEAFNSGHGCVTRTVSCPAPIIPNQLKATLSELLPCVLRAKGFVATEEGFMIVQVAGRSVNLTPWQSPRGEAPPVLGIVFIGLDDLPSQEMLADAVAQCLIKNPVCLSS